MILVCISCDGIFAATADERVPENISVICSDCLNGQKRTLKCEKCGVVLGATDDQRVPIDVKISCALCLNEQAKRQKEALEKDSPWRD